MVAKNTLLDVLPPFTHSQVIIEKKQNTHDIVKEVINAHKFFSHDYDFICCFFDAPTKLRICKNLFDFCKSNILYEIEPESNQTTKSPAAILEMGYGDCKHYAGFIGGVLSALNRNYEKNIDWCYTFASYSILDNEVQHVFVTVRIGEKEIWIDPVLCCFDTRNHIPVLRIDKNVNDFSMLTRVSGIGVAAPAGDAPVFEPVVLTAEDFKDTANFLNAVTTSVNIPVDLSDNDFDADPATVDQIKMLLYYGIIDTNSQIHPDIYINTLDSLDGQDAIDLQNAYMDFSGQVNAIGDIFGSIWNSVKQVGLAPARGAYLALVSLNIFGLATQLNAVVTNPDGSQDQNGINSLQAIWHKKLMGDTNLLLRAISNGHNKPKIFGVGDTPSLYPSTTPITAPTSLTATGPAGSTTATTAPATNSTAATVAKGCTSMAAAGALISPAVGAWIGAACTIIVTLAPIIIGVLQKKQAAGIPVDPGLINTTQPTTLSSMLPILIIGGIVLIYLKE